MISTLLNILWLKTGPLHPLDTGGKIRTYNMLRELKKRHHLTYLSLCPAGVEPAHLQAASEYSHEQVWVPWRETPKVSLRFYGELLAGFFSPLPYVIEKYRSPEMAAHIFHRDSAWQHDLIVCDFLTPSVNLFANGRPATRTLLFQHNVEALIWERLCKNARGLKRGYFHRQWRSLRRFERDACTNVTGVVGVSEEDCRLLRESYGLTNVLGAVPTGVDLEYFSSALTAKKEPGTIVFLGSMDWMPNIDGVKFYAEEIHPRILRQNPGVRVAIVGRNPPAAIKELAAKTRGLEITGTVEDVRPWLGRAEAMIVPLRIGGGTRIKIFEGMAAGLPVVSTTIGAEGLPVSDGQDIFLADTPELFARRMGELLAAPERRARLSAAGLALVREKFSWDAAARQFENYCLQVGSTHRKT